MALDFVSLLLSKDLPRQAELTMSPFLKQTVKPGTLGTDMWQNIEPDREREETDALLTKGWKLQSLQQSADSLLAAASRLENNVRKETEYWNEVLSVSERGWSVCRMPRERHNLGVRYGFSEAQGEFRNRGLAALRADDEGHVVLDRGFGNNPKVVRVRVRRGSTIIGTSQLPVVGNESELTIEARIRHARDSLYEEELFQEMTRESRSLASYKVRMRGNTIELPMSSIGARAAVHTASDSHILIDLIPLGDTISTNDVTDADSGLAQAVALASRLLLSYTHRERLQQRSHLPPPLSMKKSETSLAPILRPILALLTHDSALKSIEMYLERLRSLLSAASIEFTGTPAKLTTDFLRTSDSTHSLVSKLVAPLHTTSVLSISLPGNSDTFDFHFDVDTAIAAPLFGTKFFVTAPIGPKKSDFSDLSDLVELVDALVAGVLASGIGARIPGASVDDREACVTLPKAGVRKAAKVQVVLSSGMRGRDEVNESSLLLSCGQQRKEWVASCTETAGLFWDVVDDIVTAEK